MMQIHALDDCGTWSEYLNTGTGLEACQKRMEKLDWSLPSV